VSDSLRLRLASRTDAEFLRALRNDPVVRSQSRNPDRVTSEEHDRWLDDVLSNSMRWLYVIEAGGHPVGQVRLDCDGAVAEISIALVHEARGRGVARAALGAAAIAARALGVETLRAFVKETNLTSLHLFARAGYLEQARSGGLVELTAPADPDG
jgi:RimJ/RimL family protein N-acetyltransferase